MAYHIDQRDIVIDGFDKGMADSPYQGISDMRGANIVSIPNEASCNFATIKNSPEVLTTGSVSSVSSNRFTWTGATSLVNGQCIYFTAQSGIGVTLNVPYWVSNVNTVPGTFQLSYDYWNTFSIAGFSDGTATFESYNMAIPKHYTYDYDNNVYYLQDSNGRVWVNLTPSLSTSYWKYTGNTVDATKHGNGLVYYNHYVFAFSDYQIDFILSANPNTYRIVNPATDLEVWKYGWDPTTAQSGTTNPSMNTPYGINNPHYAISGQTNTVYYCDGSYVGSWFTTATSTLTLTGTPSSGATTGTLTGNFTGPTGNYYLQFSNYDVRPVLLTNGSTAVIWVGGLSFNCSTAILKVIFTPTILASYSFQKIAVQTESFETNQCLAIQGSDLLIGGVKNIIYVWDRLQFLYNYRIYLPESFVWRMETVNTTTYIFTGNRGRIYQTNGSQASLFKKVPDHLSDTVEPYLVWGNVASYKNQIYFGVTATTNSGTNIPNYGGLWAVDVDTGAIRITNKLSYGDYTGGVTLVIPILGNPTIGNPSGVGLWIGWNSGASMTNYGVDLTTSTPYSNYETYIDSDLIPIGTYLQNRTFEQVEFKLAKPMVTGEGVKMQYRTHITDSWTDIFETLYSATSEGNSSNMSGLSSVNWQNVQWVQLRTLLKSAASTPSYTRLREIRIR